MKLYCKSCNEYVYLKRPTSATQRCPVCFAKLSGRKQREVWKELSDEKQQRIDAVEDTMHDRRPLPGQRDLFDD